MLVKESEPIPHAYTNYAKSKLQGEHLVDALESFGIEVITLRPRAIIGPNDQVLLPRILRLMNKGRFPLFNKGEALIDLTFVDNVIYAIELALNADTNALYKKYNITNGEPRTLLSICQEIEASLKLKVRYVHLPLKPLLMMAKLIENIYLLLNIDKEPVLSEYSIGLMSYDHTLSIELAQKYLNYRPQVRLSEGLKRSLDAWKK